MVELTISNVSSIIAAIIFLTQLFVPTALSLILIALLKDDNTNATWSVVGRIIHSTHWPLILRADSVASSGVRRSVRFIARLIPLALAIIAIAAVVTPLGLHNSVEADSNPVAAPFEYARDPSALGSGTPPRSDLPFFRECDNSSSVLCPSPSDTFNNTDTIVAPIPASFTEAFQSGLDRFQDSVSSVWDIEWRSYTYRESSFSLNNLNNDSRTPVPVYRPLSMLVLNDAVEPLEGLIVDTKRGGIGFRNHSVPPMNRFGYVWSEDLLWVQPETRCVNTNLTLDFTTSDVYITEIKNLVLTDHGGFTNILQGYPEIPLGIPQDEFNLTQYAYAAAWINNFQTMLYLNVTNPAPHAWAYVDSHIGKEFPLPTISNTIVSWKRLLVRDIASYLDIPYTNSSFSTASDNEPYYPNPWNVTSDSAREEGRRCMSHGTGDTTNITAYAVNCGLMYGAAKRKDNGSPLIAEVNSNWTIPLYGCASAAKATIKTVDFEYNQTRGIKGLVVRDVRDKKYKNEQDMPLWGVEQYKLPRFTQAPLWGIFSDDYIDKPSLDMFRGASLWLPGAPTVSPILGSLPANGLYQVPLYSAYSGSSLFNDDMDYSGEKNIALLNKWQELSGNAEGASKILNLIWTDAAANSVVGTRGWNTLQPRNTENSKRDNDKPSPKKGGNNMVLVTPYNNRVRYNWIYGIPAAIVFACVAIIGAVTLFLVAVSRATPTKMRKYLFQTSAGRLMGTFIYAEDCHPQTPTKVWAQNVGLKKVDVSTHYPQPSGTELPQKKQSMLSHVPLLNKEGSSGEQMDEGTKPPA